MAIQVYKPTTPGRRRSSVVVWHDLTKRHPQRTLVVKLKSRAGRGNQGQITVRHRGGGHKRMYRIIDFKRQKYDMPGRVLSLEYDPYRSSRIALVTYEDGEKAYIIAPNTLRVGDTVLSTLKPAKATIGNRMPLEFIPLGMQVHNVELAPQQGGVLVRSAGQSATLQTIEGKFAQVQLPSGEVRVFPKSCSATIGQVSNADHSLRRIGKAGRSRWLGHRPQVLGKSMNPVDHPHGGGEGHQPIGLKAPKTLWGKKAFGVKTRKPKKHSDALIVQRRKKKH